MQNSTSWNDWSPAPDGAGFSSHGDPYPDNKDDTKRGVCFADGGFDAAPSGYSGDFHPDNKKNSKSFFFVEPDDLFAGGSVEPWDVTRGVKLSGVTEPGEGFSSMGGGVMSKYDVQASLPFYEKPTLEEVPHKPPIFFNNYNDIFTDGDTPPPKPTGKYSGLSATVHKVETDKPPSSLGSSLLKFHSEYLPSQSVFAELLKPIPSKAHKTKYNLKLLAFVHSNWCQIKVRMYEESPAVYLIEFQRRAGDSLAFNSVFREAEKYLQVEGFNVVGRGKKGGGPSLSLFAPPSVPLPPMEDGELPWPEPECMYGPVFDLAKSKCVRYQAEGATAIAEMAKAAEGKPEQKLPWKELEDVLYELLEVQETIVAYPTVKALHSFAKVHPRARDVAKKKEKALSNSSSSLVRGEAEQLRRLVASHE